MQDLSGKVAVVTGGASGIGFALAKQFVAEGMKVVLADIEEPALAKAADELRAAGAEGVVKIEADREDEIEIETVVCDVSSAESVEALKDRVLERFGAVHVVCNNAGVGGGGWVDEVPLAQWEWMLGVNFWGVLHGVRTFLPLLTAQDEGHIVNTASILGLVAAPLSAPYAVTKFGVVALSESLSVELAMKSSAVGVTVVCPGWVATNIHDSDRNRPAHYHVEPDAGEEAARKMFKTIIEAGLSPDDVAAQTIDAIKTDRFYVLTPDDNNEFIRLRMEAILAGEHPPLAMPQ